MLLGDKSLLLCVLLGVPGLEKVGVNINATRNIPIYSTRYFGTIPWLNKLGQVHVLQDILLPHKRV